MQLEELINLVVSFSLFLYLGKLIKDKGRLLPRLWIAGMVLVLISQFSTLAEAFILYDYFNTLEHFSITLASLMFFLGSFGYGRESTL